MNIMKQRIYHCTFLILLMFTIVLSGCGNKKEVIRTNAFGEKQVQKLNEVLKEKNYPYQLEYVILQNSGFTENFDKAYERCVQNVNQLDLIVAPPFASIPKWLYQDGYLQPLEQSTLEVLPKDMYHFIEEGVCVEFPSNFYRFPYVVNHSPLYYAIVKDEIADQYNIETIKDIENLIDQDVNVTYANVVFFEFLLKDKVTNGEIDWYTGIGFDDQNERFYNLFKEEKDHIQRVLKMNHNQSQISYGMEKKDADIIFHSSLKDGYRGIELQPYVFHQYSEIGLLIHKYAPSMTQQFICDLYRDKDLTSCCYQEQRWPCDFGNLELFEKEELEQMCDTSSFDYDKFVHDLNKRQSKLFHTYLTLGDVCTKEEFHSLLNHGMYYGLETIGDKQKKYEESVATQPECLQKIIDKMNQKYQSMKEGNHD